MFKWHTQFVSEFVFFDQHFPPCICPQDDKTRELTSQGRLYPPSIHDYHIKHINRHLCIWIWQLGPLWGCFGRYTQHHDNCCEGQHKEMNDHAFIAYSTNFDLAMDFAATQKMNNSFSVCFSKAITGHKNLLEMAHRPIPWNVRLHKKPLERCSKMFI